MLKALLKADIKNWILQLDLFEIQNSAILLELTT